MLQHRGDDLPPKSAEKIFWLKESLCTTWCCNHKKDQSNKCIDVFEWHYLFVFIDWFLYFHSRRPSYTDYTVHEKFSPKTVETTSEKWVRNRWQHEKMVVSGNAKLRKRVILFSCQMIFLAAQHHMIFQINPLEITYSSSLYMTTKNFKILGIALPLSESQYVIQALFFSYDKRTPP